MDLNIRFNPESVTLTPSGVPASNVQWGGSSVNPASDAISPLTANPSPLFSSITPSAHAAGAAASVEAELCSVAQASAKKLMETIHFYEHLDYLDTKNLNTEQLYNLLNDHFHLSFKPRCLRKYRNPPKRCAN